MAEYDDTTRWRVGRRVGRTIYAQLGDEPSDRDSLIGVMDTIRLAILAVEGHNAAVKRAGTGASTSEPQP